MIHNPDPVKDTVERNHVFIDSTPDAVFSSESITRKELAIGLAKFNNRADSHSRRALVKKYSAPIAVTAVFIFWMVYVIK